MKKILLIAALLFCCQAFSQFVSNPYSPTQIGDFTIQRGKIYYIKEIGVPFDPENYAKQLLLKNSLNESITVKLMSKEGLKGTFTNYPLDWTSPVFKMKKLEPFLSMPFNATFIIEKQAQGYVLELTNVWFNDLKTGRSFTLEDIVGAKGGTVFSKEKKNVRSLSILNMNLDEMFLPRMNF